MRQNNVVDSRLSQGLQRMVGKKNDQSSREGGGGGVSCWCQGSGEEWSDWFGTAEKAAVTQITPWLYLKCAENHLLMYIHYIQVWGKEHIGCHACQLRHHLHKLTKVGLQNVGQTGFKLQLLDGGVRLWHKQRERLACLGSIMWEVFSRHTFGLISSNLASFFYLFF